MFNEPNVQGVPTHQYVKKKFVNKGMENQLTDKEIYMANKYANVNSI